MKTILDFKKKKKANEKIAMVTVYDYTMARIFSESQVDCLLVGDTLAMVMHGYASTIQADTRLMALHTAAVSRGAPDKFIITDMPFLSCRQGIKTAMKAVNKLMRVGAGAVKAEGLLGHEDVIRHITESGVPVMGHLGLTPQSVHAFGGYRVQGVNEENGKRIHEEAVKLEELGCFSLVLECIPRELTARIAKNLSIPVIGIGAGPEADGQVLVWQDMFGLSGMKPKFLKTYLYGRDLFLAAINEYCREVQNGLYPGDEHSYRGHT